MSEISKTRSPLNLALQVFLALVFLAGVLVRVFSSELHLTQVGNILMAVGVLGRLLVYLRGLQPSGLSSPEETSSPLMLNQKALTQFPACDQTGPTPVERIIHEE